MEESPLGSSPKSCAKRLLAPVVGSNSLPVRAPSANLPITQKVAPLMVTRLSALERPPRPTSPSAPSICINVKSAGPATVPSLSKPSRNALLSRLKLGRVFS